MFVGAGVEPGCASSDANRRATSRGDISSIVRRRLSISSGERRGLVGGDLDSVWLRDLGSLGEAEGWGGVVAGREDSGDVVGVDIGFLRNFFFF